MFYYACACYGFIQLDIKKTLHTHGQRSACSSEVPSLQVTLGMSQVSVEANTESLC